ncbi:uncharacterized protein LACBIDRAFT_329317 [Laccaria bicolor S238N-H82]|uniref:Predicted protein n=1 Tax=Laccaria bicolor (strain S238N-H82 / ATCC MYA-4686) TaxID=486041 RepID=B0DHN3_LACBS|nr:uncharacterized protein LACBIDRAFT_329317 [Laccaria bicolor S238N-H82]EDR05864.1 predicted protein [Laccaria bicolor S238N-H82]|eukprot:XP_001883540.1 predicted protein [Laccaria bicolor S238N-H82]
MRAFYVRRYKFVLQEYLHYLSCLFNGTSSEVVFRELRRHAFFLRTTHGPERVQDLYSSFHQHRGASFKSPLLSLCPQHQKGSEALKEYVSRLFVERGLDGTGEASSIGSFYRAEGNSTGAPLGFRTRHILRNVPHKARDVEDKPGRQVSCFIDEVHEGSSLKPWPNYSDYLCPRSWTGGVGMERLCLVIKRPVPIKLFRSPPSSTVEDSSLNGPNRSWIRRKICVFIWARLIRRAGLKVLTRAVLVTVASSSMKYCSDSDSHTIFLLDQYTIAYSPKTVQLQRTTRSMQTTYSQTAVTESFRLALKEPFGPGISEDDPMVLVVEAEDAEKRSASTVQSKGLPEAVTPEPRYVYYRLYEEEGAMTSKTSFDPDDSSLGHINTLSIAPPQTVSSLRSQIVKAEGIADRKIQLFGDMDGEVPMNDNDHLTFRAQVYPGHVEDEPITLVCSQEKAEKKQKNALGRVVRDPTFNKKLQGLLLMNPRPDIQANWLPFAANEILYTNGVKTTGYAIPGFTYPGYMAMNSAGRKGFVYDSHARLC